MDDVGDEDEDEGEFLVSLLSASGFRRCDAETEVVVLGLWGFKFSVKADWDIGLDGTKGKELLCLSLGFGSLDRLSESVFPLIDNVWEDEEQGGTVAGRSK